jgi:hypothetical protein
LIKMVVAGWRGAREDVHGDVVRAGLVKVEAHLESRLDSDDVLVLSGDNPNGGVDAIAEAFAAEAGWKWESRRSERKEKLPGSGIADYRKMMRDRTVDLLVLFPGPNEMECREALAWATRYGVPFIGFPIPAELWGGQRLPR